MKKIKYFFLLILYVSVNECILFLVMKKEN